MLFCDGRIGTNAGNGQLRIVVMMMFVRPFPDRLRGKEVDTNKFHYQICRKRFLQNGPVLVIVINDKKPHIRKAAGYSAQNANGKRKAFDKGSGKKECYKTNSNEY